LACQENAVHRLFNKKSKSPTAWTQLVPRCSRHGCVAGAGWSSVLHRASGFWFNEQHWFCGPGCLQESLVEHLIRFLARDHRTTPVRTTMPMGLMMLARGIVSDAQLRDGLRLHRTSGERIGACLQRLGFVTEGEIASVVATQWGCPVFPAASVQPGCSLLVPCSLIERHRMLPVHLASQGRRLFVGFGDKVNHSVLVAVEHMLGCGTEACIVPESTLLQGIDARKQDTSGEVVVRLSLSAAETAGMILSYAQQTTSEGLRLQEVDDDLWVRFQSRRSHLDLVFLSASL
jgi:hypothetical protein